MGSALTKFYDSSDYLYDKYYPKSKWLRPAYTSSALMVSLVGLELFTKNATKSNTFVNFVFLSSLGGVFGIQIWVGFVSGLTMIRLLPRHQFGLVQSHLFPKYFFLSSLFTFGSLASYLQLNPLNSWKNSTLTLGCLLGVSFVANVLNFSYFDIKTIEYNVKMHQIEKNAGEGLTTVGRIMQESKIENDPEYLETKKKFYIFHGLSSLSNFISFGATIGQFYLLSSRNFFSF